MNRYARKRDAMGRANDDNAARRVGAPRPWSEGGCGDRARVYEAGVRRDDDLWRDASIGARLAARAGDQGVQRVGLRRIEHARDLRGVNFAASHGDGPIAHAAKSKRAQGAAPERRIVFARRARDILES
jgi:hypothetical protein